MSRRSRRRVDWDEELRKTEQIRRKGFFLSALCLAVAASFIFGASRLSGSGIGFGRKLVFIACLTAALLVMRFVLARRERLRRQRQEAEEDLILQELREMRDKSAFK